MKMEPAELQYATADASRPPRGLRFMSTTALMLALVEPCVFLVAGVGHFMELEKSLCFGAIPALLAFILGTVALLHGRSARLDRVYGGLAVALSVLSLGGVALVVAESIRSARC